MIQMLIWYLASNVMNRINENSLYMAQTLMFVNSIFKSDKNYFSQTFLAQCKHKPQEKTIKWFIAEDLTDSVSNSDCDFEVALICVQTQF